MDCEKAMIEAILVMHSNILHILCFYLLCTAAECKMFSNIIAKHPQRYVAVLMFIVSQFNILFIWLRNIFSASAENFAM